MTGQSILHGLYALEHSIVWAWRLHERVISYVAYNAAYAQAAPAPHADLFGAWLGWAQRVVMQPRMGWDAWMAQPYAAILGKEYEHSPISSSMVGTMTVIHLIEAGIVAMVIIYSIEVRRWRGRHAPAKTANSTAALIPTEKEQQRAKEKAERAAAQVEANVLYHTLKRRGWTNGRGWPVGTHIGTGHQVFIPEEQQTMHVSVEASTGGGKNLRQSERYWIHETRYPTRKRASLILFDPKANNGMTRRLIGLYAARGWRVIVYDPSREGSARYNVAATARTPEQLSDLCAQWVASLGMNHPHYGRQARSLLFGILYYLRHEAGADWRSVSFADAAAYVAATPADDMTDQLAALAARSGDAVMRQHAGKLAEMAHSKAKRADALQGVHDALAGLASAPVQASMAGHDIDWWDFVKRPTVIFCTTDMHRAGGLRPVLATFLGSASTELQRIAGTRPLKRRVRVGIDEAANFTIPRLDGMLSTWREFNIGCQYNVQSGRDIGNVYPRGVAERIRSNTSTRVVLAQSDRRDLKGYADPAMGLPLHALMEYETALVECNAGITVRVKTRVWKAVLSERFYVWWHSHAWRTWHRGWRAVTLEDVLERQRTERPAQAVLPVQTTHEPAWAADASDDDMAVTPPTVRLSKEDEEGGPNEVDGDVMDEEGADEDEDELTTELAFY